MNPYISNNIPTIGHPKRTIKIPPKNEIEALIFCLWKKNFNVRWTPITQLRPTMNNIYKNNNNNIFIIKYTIKMYFINFSYYILNVYAYK